MRLVRSIDPGWRAGVVHVIGRRWATSLGWGKLAERPPDAWGVRVGRRGPTLDIRTPVFGFSVARSRPHY